MDVKAIFISRPEKNQKKFYNGKYKAHIVKIQVVVNNKGIPMDIRGLYPGTKHDITIWKHSALDLEGSRLFADNAYVGVPNSVLLTPFKHASLYDSINGKRRKTSLRFTRFERQWNRVHRRWRSRVEHYIGFLSRFRIVGSKFRGKRIMESDLLPSAIKILSNLDAWYLSEHSFRPIPSVAWFPVPPSH